MDEEKGTEFRVTNDPYGHPMPDDPDDVANEAVHMVTKLVMGMANRGDVDPREWNLILIARKVDDAECTGLGVFGFNDLREAAEVIFESGKEFVESMGIGEVNLTRTIVTDGEGQPPE